MLKARVEALILGLRKAVPVRLVPLLAELHLRLAWSRPAARERARQEMRFLLEIARPEVDIDMAARDYLRRMALRGEMRWHPEMVTQQRVVGVEHLIEARDRGKGVIVNFMHHGAFDGFFASLIRYGVKTTQLSYPSSLSDDAPAWIKQHVKVCLTGGNRALSSEIGSIGIIDLLRNGEVVSIASDVPGHARVRFVGRDLLGASGAASLAFLTGAPVVMLTAERDAEGEFLHVHPALWATDFPDRSDLLEHLLRVHEKNVLRWPEAVDIPTSRWGVPEPDSGPAAGADSASRAAG